MKQNFNYCLQQVLKFEGGYTNDPSDSGGPTKYGITITDVRKYIKKNATAEDVRNITSDQAANIFKTKYWDSLGCDSLASGVDLTVFDYGVNSGLGRPRKALQRFSSLKGADLVDAINNERTAFLRALAVQQSKDAKFLKGWLNRVETVRAESLGLIKNDIVSGPASGGVVATSGVAVSQYFHSHQTVIILGAILAAVGIGTAVHLIRNKGN